MKTYRLPAKWAEALITGDVSGLSGGDIAGIHEFYRANRPGGFVGLSAIDSDMLTYCFAEQTQQASDADKAAWQEQQLSLIFGA
jgi:hypothetical protein